MVWPERDHPGRGGVGGEQGHTQEGAGLLLRGPRLVGLRVQPRSGAQDNVTEE